MPPRISPRAKVTTGIALPLAAALVAAAVVYTGSTAQPTASGPTATRPTTTATHPTDTTTPTTSPPTASPTATDPTAISVTSSTPTNIPTSSSRRLGASRASAAVQPTTSPTTTPPAEDPPVVSPPATPSATPAQRAAAYVVSQLKDGNHVEVSYGTDFFPDLGQTSDVALGLAASNSQTAALNRVLTYLDTNASAYVHGVGDGGTPGGDGKSNYAGPTGKLALVAQVTGKDPSSFGGIDLISELRGLMDNAGRYRDDSEFGDYSNPLGQAFDILALERGTSVGAPQVAVDYLVTAQCPDGGFADAFLTAGSPCVSSPDATGLALQALVATGAGCPAALASSWLTKHQAPDGSFGSDAVDPTKPATGNVNSTAYAALGLTAAGQSTSTIVDYLTAVQNSDGGLAIQPSIDKTSNVYATAQALDALAGSSFLTIGRSPIAPATPACPA